MSMSLNDTPRAMRLHIGLFGRRNSGKSSLINALTGQHVATVSDVPGTTTDPVYKSMEIHGIGPVVFIDTAGFDDSGSLGALRVERTRDAAKETDIALVLLSTGPDDGAGAAGNEDAFRWLEQLKRRGVPAISVISRIDESTAAASLAQVIEARTGERPVLVSAATGEGLAALRAEIARHLPEDYRARSITAEVCESGDVVLLVMPQDIQAPKGRLILPQVQTLRELLDRLTLAEKDREQPGPELRKHIAKLRKELDSTEEWRDFTTYFEQVNASFLARLRENHPGLTASELRFLSLVCIHLSGKEIAQLLHITPEYCKKRKQQIARKMGLATSGELYGYLVSLQS